MFFFFDESENNNVVPGFEQTIKPVLFALQSMGGKAPIEELDKTAIQIMNLPKEVTQIMHKDSNKQSEISYRMAWARTYLKKYGLIKNESRGIWSFTDKFDGDIDKIDVSEILQKVRKGNSTGGDEKQTLTGFESVLAFENMIVALVKDLAAKEGKSVQYFSDHRDVYYDISLPDGLENCEKEIKCVIKYVSTVRQNINAFYEEIAKNLQSLPAEGMYLLVTNVIVPAEVRVRLGTNVIVWDKDDLIKRIEPDAVYAQYLINPKQALIKEMISSDNSDAQRKNEKGRYIQNVKAAFRKGDVVLFLGAGVSKDGGIPLWATLIKKLHIFMLNQLTKDQNLSFEQQKMVQELAFNNEMESPLLQMRYIKSAFENEEYYRLVHEALYDQGFDINTRLLNAITKISTPQRAYCGIKSIITYNFDNLLEMRFEQKDISYNVVSCEEDRSATDKLNIYHVHGYLPNNFEKGTGNPDLVFSEEDYHRVYRDSYSWSNLAQLSALKENTCLFIGSSLTDPNLRRLLDVAARNGENARHYAFMKRVKIETEKADKEQNKNIFEIYQRIDDNIQAAYYKELGLNIIWVDEYEEIPDILNSLL